MKNSREQKLASPAHEEPTDEARAQLRPLSGPVLNWLPGESLYSLIARNHYYRGHQNPSHTVHAFFGTLSGKSLQKNMTEIDVFVARTEGFLGTAQYVLEERTLLRFYRVFLAKHGDRFLEPNLRTSDSILKFPLGLRTSRFRTTHPLKACPICLEEDGGKTVFQYWRLVHQFPGVWVCLEHDRGLQEVTIKPTPQQKFLWQTPTVERLQPAPRILADSEAFSKFRNLSQLIISITSDKEEGIRQLAETRTRFCHYLANAGLVLPAGRLKVAYKNQVAYLCSSFLEFSAVPRMQHEFAALPDNVDAAFRLLSRYVNCSSAVKPLETIVITAWIENYLPR